MYTILISHVVRRHPEELDDELVNAILEVGSSYSAVGRFGLLDQDNQVGDMVNG